MPIELPLPLPAACDPLLTLVFAKVDHSMLEEISMADYGCDASEHLNALLTIKEESNFTSMDWVPKEVLELTRHSEPIKEARGNTEIETRKHWIRLFACTVLLRAGVEPSNRDRMLGETGTIIQMVESALVLGAAPSMAAFQFLAWLVQESGTEDWLTPYLSTALLMIAIKQDIATYPLVDSLSTLIQISRDDSDSPIQYSGKSPKWKKYIRQTLMTCKKYPQLHETAKILL